MSKVRSSVWHSVRLAGVRLGTPGALEVASSLTWVIKQQPMVLRRFDPCQNDAHTSEGFKYWREKFDKFLSRAELLTLESPEGRQAIAEFAATSIGLLASVWRVYGPPPCRPISNYSPKEE